MDVKVDESVFMDGKIDLTKMGAVIYASGERCYYGLGPDLGVGFSIGNKFMKK